MGSSLGIYGAHRLAFARETYGIIPINFDEVDDPAEMMVEAMAGRGVDATVKALGFEAKGSVTETVPCEGRVTPEGCAHALMRAWNSRALHHGRTMFHGGHVAAAQSRNPQPARKSPWL